MKNASHDQRLAGEQALITYGRWLVAAVTGRTPGPPPAWTEQFVRLLSGRPDQVVSAGPLQSILTLVTDSRQPAGPPAYLPPAPLSLDPAGAGWDLFPAADPAAAALRDRGELAASFETAAGGEQNFEHFFYLMRQYASTLPNTYGEPGVSLFEQWKIVAALVQISGSTTQIPAALGLVGGDIPGIQHTINLVTAKGAAKAMRGRSAFIQLLGHALVQRLLDTLDLGPANVVYDAGGNFVLLTGWEEGEEGTVHRVHEVANDVNRVLLAGAGGGAERFDGFHGDLSVALAAVPLTEGLEALQHQLPPAGPAGRQVSRWHQAEKRLKDAIAAAKSRPFGDLALHSGSDWRLLFETEPAETNDFCAVCRRQRDATEPPFRPLDQEDTGPASGSNDICPECWGFNDLANDLGHAAARLVLARLQPSQPRAWQHALHAVSGRWVSIEKATAPRAAASDTVLVFDPDEFGAGMTGFLWLSHTTPAGEAGNIKSNNELANATSGGFKRLGVLRMDVDNLGDRIVHGLPHRTPMQTAELSQALERFFAGRLDRICAQVDGGEGLFYVLFAGGDDLFVIGPWDRMPDLAIAIREDFARYTHGNPALGISGGIAVVGAHEPLHRAGDEAHDALKEAKDLPGKDALTFLGRAHTWAGFGQVVALKDDICELADDYDLGNALITRLLAIDRRYHRDRGRKPYGVKGATPPRLADPLFYGPWMWQQAYALARLREGRSAEVGRKLDALRDKILDGKQVVHLGLAARWAQWLLRKGA